MGPNFWGQKAKPTNKATLSKLPIDFELGRVVMCVIINRANDMETVDWFQYICVPIVCLFLRRFPSC